jgi:hypothetical protein
MEFDAKNEIKKVENLPIYVKGEEILDLIYHIGKLIPKDDTPLQKVKASMYNDAMQLTVKVASAESGQLYDLKMQCAAIIRKAAQDLMLINNSLEMLGFKHVEYIKIMSDLIEEYRLLYIEWVARFDQGNHVVDRWGLFNPPGVKPDDLDPDDYIPSSTIAPSK